MSDKRDTDMVTMSIIDSTMTAICREMGITLMRTSYSTIFNEALDFTCALASPNGEMIAQAEFCPSMIGGVPLLVRSCVLEIPLDEWEPGDVVVHNDPYRGGLHCPEHTMIQPVFVDGELMAFAMTIGHLVEIGGMVPGAFAGEATEIFQEGIRVPPVFIKKRGEDVEEVWKLLLANVRTPRFNYGDLRALIAGTDVGERQLATMIEKYGKEDFRRNISDLLDYSESRMRAEIQAIPDGKYSFSDEVEDDGIDKTSYTINVAVHINGDEAVVDYSGTSPQAKGPINATLGVSYSAAYNGMLHITDESIPTNSGCFRPIRVVSPPGTLLNVDYPAPEVGGNTETHCKIAGAVIGAMSPAVPDRTMAAEGATHTNFVFGGTDEESGEAFVCYAIELSGWGGRNFADGNDATDSINGNCRVIPVEVFETRFPMQCESYIMVEDSGGAGKFRGGLSTQRTLKSLDTAITGSQMSDRHRNRAWGLHGGLSGGLAGTWHMAANTVEWRTIDDAFGKVSPSKWSNVTIAPGDRIRFQTPGGGGWGAPGERPQQRVREDLAEGYISARQAHEVYGLDGAGDD
ncbi:MAG: hydantoinase B/oxoprolinase family protein [Alphaproteobacteria bacterium]|jgi:N-methylhydantoinase B/oxoprolinase/acetone carboxylase alpha subunit|nr:hydantoinase B/oxoprolinase family protein [Alphaproteobacteria bacterium]MDP6590423.1 hydantoinase B/oxoprolinase family protein [Alphaproteobacteria bacterium]MDP6816636.1 hydantoinase B/oxoprolinase family protein [Alphaproteobacteria bacterium]